MARVVVPLARARAGALPPVCVVSGRPADGYCPLVVSRSLRRGTTVRLPLHASVFDRWVRTSQLRLRGGLGAAACGLVAVATVRFPTVAALAALAAVACLIAFVLASWRQPSVTPELSIDHTDLVIGDAHPAFAAVVTG